MQTGNNLPIPTLGPSPGEHRGAAPRPALVAKYAAFSEAIQPAAAVVYHPCSGDDCSPSVAFPNSRVIYADTDAADVAALQAMGADAHEADAQTFDPGMPVDILIMLNPTIRPDGPASYVRPGGYALVNNYHSTANILRQSDEFELIGIVHDRTPDGHPVLDTDRPEDHWNSAVTDEEFRASPEYLPIAMMMKRRTGNAQPSLEEYMQVIKDIKEAHPDAIEDGGYLWFTEDGNSRMFPYAMPSKKGHMDDFFVFRRRPAPEASEPAV